MINRLNASGDQMLQLSDEEKLRKGYIWTEQNN